MKCKSTKKLILEIIFLTALCITVSSSFKRVEDSRVIQFDESTEIKSALEKYNNIFIIMDGDCPNCIKLRKCLEEGIPGDYYINILYLTSENRGVVLDRYPIKYTPAIVIKNGENTSFNYIRNWQNPGLDLSQLLAQYPIKNIHLYK